MCDAYNTTTGLTPRAKPVQLHNIPVTDADLADIDRWAHNSGIQPWSFDRVAAARLRKYNARQSAENPHHGRFAGKRGAYVPCHLVPLDKAGNVADHDADRLIAWLQSHRAQKVKRVALTAPAHGPARHEFNLEFLLGALTAARASRVRTGALLRP